MDLTVINFLGEKSPFRIATFADHLRGLGVPTKESRSVATAFLSVALEAKLSEVTSSALRGAGDEIASRGLRALENGLEFAGTELEETAHSALSLVLGEGGSEGAGRSERAEESSEGEPAAPESVFEAPVLAILDQASCIRDVNELVSGFLSDLAYFSRGVAEETLVKNLDGFMAELGEMELTSRSLDRLRERLLTSHFPIGTSVLARRVGEAFKLLTATGVINSDDPLGSIQNELSSANQQFSTTIDIDQRDRGGGRGRDEPEAAFSVVASIDRPLIVSRSTYSATQIEPATNVRDRDDLIATEVTYLGDVEEGFRKNDAPERATLVPPRYRPTINDDLPDGFFENLEVGLRVYVFNFSLVEVNNIPGVKLIKKLLDDNEKKIKDAIEDLAEKAGEAAGAFATASGFGSLSSGVESLVKSVVKGGLKKIYEMIEDILGGSKFTPASIIHFVSWDGGALPESIFRLHVEGKKEMMLYEIGRSAQSPLSTSWLIQRPPYKVPYYPPGGRPVAFLRTSRYMKGPSTDPRRPCPADMWRKIGAKKQAAVWSATEANKGFHVLVSIKEDGGDGLYVWGLRADVRAIAAEDRVAAV
ncbi:hypothetical protein MYX77_07120 [Acidobacteriia bacterium AH_259_A11_L15]|nr:hypothetical protein [Acidobacteriia bacterium AH_259_A11_L15]